MRKKIIGIFVCMLLMTTAVVSAVRILNIASPRETDKHISTDTIEKESNEKSVIIEEQDDDNPPQPLATKTGYLSIPAAAFTPVDNYCKWYNNGREYEGTGSAIAPVFLPHKAEVTKVNFYWYDTNPSVSGILSLCRSKMDGFEEKMAQAYTDVGGYGISYDDTIDYKEIENDIYCYYLKVGVGYDYHTCGVIIEYTYKSIVSSENIADGDEAQVPNMVIK